MPYDILDQAPSMEHDMPLAMGPGRLPIEDNMHMIFYPGRLPIIYHMRMIFLPQVPSMKHNMTLALSLGTFPLSLALVRAAMLTCCSFKRSLLFHGRCSQSCRFSAVVASLSKLVALRGLHSYRLVTVEVATLLKDRCCQVVTLKVEALRSATPARSLPRKLCTLPRSLLSEKRVALSQLLLSDKSFLHDVFALTRSLLSRPLLSRLFVVHEQCGCRLDRSCHT
ncbi:hypothetical protein V8F33_008323 [Rhypophila sp. PSN 637]